MFGVSSAATALADDCGLFLPLAAWGHEGTVDCCERPCCEMWHHRRQQQQQQQQQQQWYHRQWEAMDCNASFHAAVVKWQSNAEEDEEEALMCVCVC